VKPKLDRFFGKGKPMKYRLLTAALALALPATASAQTILYSDNFDSGTSGSNWATNVSPTTAASGADATFNFDYSTVGIPSAPNSVGGTTTGLRLRVNRPGTATFSGISVSPLGQSFTGDYTLRFDAWQNFNGPLPAGGSGSTQVTGGGIGANTNVAQFPGNTINGVYAAATGDGGSGQDYRMYVGPGTPVGAPLADTSGAYAAGNTAGSSNNSNAYYGPTGPGHFGGVSATAAQLALFPQQTGATANGALGMEWHTWTISKVGNTVTWSIRNRDGVDVLIATADVSGQPFGADNNIFLGQFDVNATSSADPNADSLLFGLIDNVVVTPVPEPGTLALAGLALPVLYRLRRRRKV